MIMRFRPANIRLINRRLKLPRLLLALSSRKRKDIYKNIPTDFAVLTWSLHIRAMRSLSRNMEIFLRSGWIDRRLRGMADRIGSLKSVMVNPLTEF
jgi:hypothetical protein